MCCRLHPVSSLLRSDSWWHDSSLEWAFPRSLGLPATQQEVVPPIPALCRLQRCGGGYELIRSAETGALGGGGQPTGQPRPHRGEPVRIGAAAAAAAAVSRRASTVEAVTRGANARCYRRWMRASSVTGIVNRDASWSRRGGRGAVWLSR